LPSRLSHVGEVADRLFALSHDLLCEVGLDGYFKRVNPSFERTLGWSNDELLARPVLEFVHPHDREATRDAMARLGTDGVPEIVENRYLCRDGSHRWLSWHASPPDEHGLLYAVARDVTEQKSAEAALRESEERFRGFIEAAHEGVWALDVVGRTTYVNSRMAELLGYAAEQLVGRPLFDFMAPAAAFEARTLFARRQRGIPESHPFVFQRADGATLHTIVTASSLRDASGTFAGALALVTDVTERRRAEEALRTSERFTDVLLDTSPDCVKLLDLDGRLEQMNATGLCLMEVEDPTDLKGQVWASLWPGDGARLAADAVAAASAGRVGRFSEFCPTCRGTPKWWDVTVTPLRDGAGRVVRLLAVSRDVTEARHAEERLRASEARYRTLSESSPLGIFESDRSGSVAYANPRLLQIWGASEDEVIGRGWMARVHPEDLPALLEKLLPALESGLDCVHECRLQLPDGTVRWVRGRAAPRRDASGTVVGTVGTIEDITERRRDEDEQRRQALTFSLLHDAVIVTDAQGNVVDWNPGAERTFGYTKEEMLGRSTADFYPDDVAAAQHAAIHAGLTGEGRWSGELRIRRRDGTDGVSETTVVMLRDAQGNFIGGVGVNHDVTERVRAEAALREREALLRGAFEHAPIGMALTSPDGRWLRVNRALCDILGYSEAELLATSFQAITYGDDLSISTQRVEELITERRSTYQIEKRYVHRQGHAVWVSLSVALVRDDEEQPLYLLAQIQDITERMRTVTALRESERRAAAQLEGALDCVVTIDAEGQILEFNPAAERTFGYARAAVLGRPMAELIVPPAMRAAHRNGLAGHLATGESRILGRRIEVPAVRADGSEFPAELTVVRLPVDGAPVFTAFMRDISERRQAEDALRASERRFRLATRATSDIVYDWDIATDELFWGETLMTSFGYDPAQVAPQLAWWTERVHPEDVDRVSATVAATLAGDATGWSAEYRFRRADDTYATVLDRGYLLRDDAGRPVRFVGSMSDLTERERLQAQLRQSQKLEAVGRLAGGVAHDFNNLIQVITAGTMFAREAIPEDSPALPDLAEIDMAAGRAAALTRQLLAFSRQQVLRPEHLNLNRVVATVEKMLRRVIGADVALATDLQPELALVHADAGQLEQVLMNLALNARDAMPRGGTLALETENVRVGPAAAAARPGLRTGAYVALRVRDTGTGMDESTRTQVFEPFFTTKEPGKGTGLGLATVYGIVNQSGGFVYVDSAPDAGSTFTVLLPAVAGAVESGESTEARVAHALLRGTETVLLVEDEASVRTAVRRMLERAGYTVLEARHGADALEILDAHAERIALVLTDVVMPEMGASVLLERLRARCPGKRTLLMSGYSAEAVARQGAPVDGVALLAKPFTADVLLRRVREVLDGPAPA
jgi:PAS domain S-box-containing protein